MEKKDITINNDYNTLITYAITDKNITALQFRVLTYICLKPHDVLVSQMMKSLNIKTQNTATACIKSLINNQYITREKSKRLIKKGTPFYDYSININKKLLPNNDNSSLIDSNLYLRVIDDVFKYFFLKIPCKNEVAIYANKKAIELMIFKDGYTVEQIKSIIDYISIDEQYSFIKRPTTLRKNIKSIDIKV